MQYVIKAFYIDLSNHTLRLCYVYCEWHNDYTFRKFRGIIISTDIFAANTAHMSLLT